MIRWSRVVGYSMALMSLWMDVVRGVCGTVFGGKSSAAMLVESAEFQRCAMVGHVRTRWVAVAGSWRPQCRQCGVRGGMAV